MAHTVIDDSELIEVIEKKVDLNGRISIGRKYIGETVRAYIIKSD